MPPRGRSTRRGNTRMDAAVDAMKDLGFKPNVVRQSVKRLLKVYGGDDYWVFIEHDSYKVLIDFILDNLKDASDDIDDTRSTMDTETPTGGPSCEPATEAAVNTELIAADTALDSSSHGAEALELDTPVNISGAKYDNVAVTMKDNASDVGQKKQRAYHGWICDNDDEEEEENLVYLTPEPLPEAIKQERETRKRIKRWDVRPNEQV